MSTTLSWREMASSSLHDYSHFVDEFRTNMADWSDRLLGERARGVLGNDLLKSVRRDFENVRKRLDADFTLVIAGDFKRGKSTLINALLGQVVASSNVTPETVTINRFRYSPTLSVVANLANGAKAGLELDDIRLEKLEPLLDKLGSPVSHLQVEVPAEWLQGVTIVDTPGLGDMLSKFDSAVQDYLNQADSVIYVVSALSPLSESEERFLRQSLAPHEFPKLTFVVNMIDFAQTPAEAQRLMERITPRLHKLFPQCQVFAISALDELCRQVGSQRPNPAQSAGLEEQFEALRTHLEQSIFVNRQRIQLDRSCELAERLLGRLEETSRRLRSALERDEAQLGQALEECENGSSDLHRKIAKDKEELSQYIHELGQQSGQWMSEFMDRFSDSVPNQLEGSTIESVQRYFMFFLSDTVRQALSQCVQAHQGAIVARVQDTQKQFHTDMRQLGGLASAQEAAESLSRQALWDSPWTGQDEFQAILSFTGVGELVNIFMDSKKKASQLNAYVTQVRSSLGDFRNSVRGTVAKVYASLADQVLLDLEAGFRNEMEGAAASMRQARELQAQGQSKSAQTTQVLDDVEECCQEARVTLEELQQRLWLSEVVTVKADSPSV